MTCLSDAKKAMHYHLHKNDLSQCIAIVMGMTFGNTSPQLREGIQAIHQHISQELLLAIHRLEWVKFANKCEKQ